MTPREQQLRDQSVGGSAATGVSAHITHGLSSSSTSASAARHDGRAHPWRRGSSRNAPRRANRSAPGSSERRPPPSTACRYSIPIPARVSASGPWLNWGFRRDPGEAADVDEGCHSRPPAGGRHQLCRWAPPMTDREDRASHGRIESSLYRRKESHGRNGDLGWTPWLAGFRAERGCAISLCVDLDPSVTPTAGDADARVSSLLAEGERRLAKPPGIDAREAVALKNDFGGSATSSRTSSSATGPAGSPSSRRGLDNVWRPRRSSSRFRRSPDGNEFHLAPLVPLVGRGEGALVAVVNRERGLYRLRGAARRDRRPDEEPPRRTTRAAGRSRDSSDTSTSSPPSTSAVADAAVRRGLQGRVARLVIASPEETGGGRGAAVPGGCHALRAGRPGRRTPAGEVQAAVKPCWSAPARKRRAGSSSAGERSWRDDEWVGWSALEAASDSRVEILIYGEGPHEPGGSAVRSRVGEWRLVPA